MNWLWIAAVLVACALIGTIEKPTPEQCVGFGMIYGFSVAMLMREGFE